MTSNQAVDSVAGTICAYLQGRTNAPVAHGQDLSAAGVLTSMLAMEIVVFLESTFQISVVGRDLKLDNFRSVNAMVALVTRLRESEGAE